MRLPPGTRLCPHDALGSPGAKGLSFGAGTGRLELVVVRLGDEIRAFVNACPHQGATLETLPDRFFDADGRLLVCSLHGASFRPLDGVCVAGPCKGKALAPVAVRIDDSWVCIA